MQIYNMTIVQQGARYRTLVSAGIAEKRAVGEIPDSISNEFGLLKPLLKSHRDSLTNPFPILKDELSGFFPMTYEKCRDCCQHLSLSQGDWESISNMGDARKDEIDTVLHILEGWLTTSEKMGGECSGCKGLLNVHNSNGLCSSCDDLDHNGDQKYSTHRRFEYLIQSFYSGVLR